MGQLLTRNQFFFLVLIIVFALLVILLCGIIFFCQVKEEPKDYQEDVITETQDFEPEEDETIVLNIREPVAENTGLQVSFQVQRPISSIPDLSRIQGRVNVSEINPINYQNPDLDILRHMGADEYLISFLAGEQFYRETNYDRALEEYNASINRNGEFIEAFVSRGNTWIKKRDYNRAIEDFTRAIRLDNTRAEIYNYRGFARAELAAGNVREMANAIEDFSRAITLNRNYVDALINRSHAFFVTGNFDRVIEDCTRIITLEPLNAVIWNRRGSAWYAKEEDDRAIADFSEAIRLNNNYAIAFYNRANAWYNKRELNNALSDINRCLVINPSFAAAHVTREKILEMQNR